MLVTDGREALGDSAIELSALASECTAHLLPTQHGDSVPGGAHLRLVGQTSGSKSIGVAHSPAVESIGLMGEAKPQVEVFGFHETLIEGPHVGEHALAHHDSGCTNEVALQECAFQLFVRDHAPGVL